MFKEKHITIINIINDNYLCMLLISIIKMSIIPTINSSDFKSIKKDRSNEPVLFTEMV